mgnify:CR=1 FL=1
MKKLLVAGLLALLALLGAVAPASSDSDGSPVRDGRSDSMASTMKILRVRTVQNVSVTVIVLL